MRIWPRLWTGPALEEACLRIEARLREAPKC